MTIERQSILSNPTERQTDLTITPIAEAVSGAEVDLDSIPMGDNSPITQLAQVKIPISSILFKPSYDENQIYKQLTTSWGRDDSLTRTWQELAPKNPFKEVVDKYVVTKPVVIGPGPVELFGAEPAAFVGSTFLKSSLSLSDVTSKVLFPTVTNPVVSPVLVPTDSPLKAIDLGIFGPHLTYSLGVKPAATPTENAGAIAMTADQKVAAHLAIDMWDDLVPFRLVEDGSANADITIGVSSTTNNNGTYAHPNLGAPVANDTPILSQNIWLASTWTEFTPTYLKVGQLGLADIEHELGHSLGLSHPGEYNAGVDPVTKKPIPITFVADAEYQQDNRGHTIMSYFGGYEQGSGWQPDGTELGRLYAATPMIDDVMAIQRKYGADMTTRTGDTTYGFNSSFAATDPKKAIFDFSVNTTPIFTIWDAGGTDTIDARFTYADQTINLNPGTYSSLLGMKDNVGIAFGADIEKAVGGYGNDTFISGGSVGRTFVFQKAASAFQSDGQDTVVGFRAGNSIGAVPGNGGKIIQDHLQFDKADLGSFASVLAHAKQVGADTVITHEFGATVTLKGVALSALDAANFVFA